MLLCPFNLSLEAWNLVDKEEAVGTGSCFPFQGYKKTLLRLRLRKKQVSDVQKVLQGGEQEIQFEDFTNTLRK